MESNFSQRPSFHRCPVTGQEAREETEIQEVLFKQKKNFLTKRLIEP